MNTIRSLILVLTLSTPVFAQGKPILLIFKSDRCPPCRQFDQTMATDRNFCNTLQSSFDLRVLNIDTEEGRATANSHGILQIPAFIVFKNNKPVIKPIYGFSPTRSGKALFLSQLSIVSQPQEIIEEQQLPLPQQQESIIEVPQDNVRNIIEESTDRTNNRIREALSELRSDLNRSLTASEEKIKQVTTLNKVKFNEIDNKVSDLIDSQNSIELKLNKVTDTVSNLSETVTNIHKTVTNINTTQSSFEEVLNNTQQTTQQTEKPESSGLFGTLTKFGIGAAATMFGWPIAGTALGTAALGLGIGFIRNKLKKNKQYTHPVTQPPEQPTQYTNQPPTSYTPYTHPTNHLQPQPTQQYSPYKVEPTTSDTRFITKEVDIVGESYKEAIRKVANTLGDTNPAYKDVAAMIDHTAKEIERGKRRPKDKDSNIKPETDLKMLWEDK